MFTVAIVGRPNVGKSTLFNRLAGRRRAITGDQPGITRDWIEASGEIQDQEFCFIDTAGLDDKPEDEMHAWMQSRTHMAFQEKADVVMFVIDARAGVTPLDEDFARVIRRSGRPVILVANKTENDRKTDIADAARLGFGEPLCIAAEHNVGMIDLYVALLTARETAEVAAAAAAKAKMADVDPAVLLDQELTQDSVDQGHDDLAAEDFGEESEQNSDEDVLLQDTRDFSAQPLKVGIVGRPNVGKSTLLNTFLKEDRALTGEIAGLTRDPITGTFETAGLVFEITDTAGLRRRKHMKDFVDRKVESCTQETIKYSEVVVVVVDSTAGLDRQDLAIARSIIDEGRALILALNKWDHIRNKQQTLTYYKEVVKKSLSQAEGVVLMPISALKNQGLDKLIDELLTTYQIWNHRIGTGPLNQWLRDKVESFPPPLASGRRLKVRYMTQSNTRPPTFAVFVNKPLPKSYINYLTRGLRQDFGLWGVPIRIMMRQGKNPYAPK
jgi:GTP-binding protein